MPDWLREAKDLPETPEAVEISTTERDDELAWINEIETEESAAKETDDMPDWLREEVEESAPSAPPVPKEAEREAPQSEPKIPQVDSESPLESVQEDEKVGDDAPTWIKAMEKSSAEALPPAVKKLPPAETEEDLPSWLDDLEGGAGKEEKKISDEPLPDWMKADESQSTRASEWKSVDMSSEEKALSEAEAASASTEEVSKEKSEAEKKRSRRRKRMDTTLLRDIRLMGAQAALDEGNIPAALEEYGKIIKKNRLLDEVIYDLREALVDYPIDISIIQMLGDAYMRAGRLQEAIDTYTNAEKLLR